MTEEIEERKHKKYLVLFKNHPNWPGDKSIHNWNTIVLEKLTESKKFNWYFVRQK